MTIDGRPSLHEGGDVGIKESLVSSRKQTETPIKILALVLAGGKGTRLYPLTAEHAKPALPFVNGFRIIDFVLSNLVNSKISTIYVLAQYKPHSLVKHIEEVWAPRLAGPSSRIQLLLPRSASPAEQYRGTADAVYQNLRLIERHRPELVAVFAADHVYRMDVRQMADFHQERRADVTVAAVPVPIERAPSFGQFYTDADIRWFDPELRLPNWADRGAKRLACLIHEGEGGALYLIFNASVEPAAFRVPPAPNGMPWRLAVDTGRESPEDLFSEGEELAFDSTKPCSTAPRSSVVLLWRRGPVRAQG